MRKVWTSVRVILGSPEHGLRTAWRLGLHTDPGWFDTSGSLVPGRFVLATVFRLHWQLPEQPPDGIYNMLHAVTMGHANRHSKTHLEQLVQILHGDLHITCRITDSSGAVQRNTVALPDSWQSYQHRDMLLIYTSDIDANDATMLDTNNVLYDLHSLEQLQCLPHRVCIPLNTDIDFASWPAYRVICDHEQHHVPRDHVIVHGSCNVLPNVCTSFEILRVWGSLGQTLNPLDQSNVQTLAESQIPDQIDSVDAWYNCDCARTVNSDTRTWALCTGRYRHRHSLGLELA